MRAIVHDDGVRDFEAMNDIKEEKYGMLRFDHGNRSSFYPLCKLVYGDKQVGVAPGAFLSDPTRSSPQTMNGQVMGIVWSAWVDR